MALLPFSVFQSLPSLMLAFPLLIPSAPLLSPSPFAGTSFSTTPSLPPSAFPYPPTPLLLPLLLFPPFLPHFLGTANNLRMSLLTWVQRKSLL